MHSKIYPIRVTRGNIAQEHAYHEIIRNNPKLDTKY